MANLPPHVRRQAEQIALKDMPVAASPFSLGCVEKMAGYPDKYKIRIGDFRVGLTIDSRESIVLFERVADRKEIYRVFP